MPRWSPHARWARMTVRRRHIGQSRRVGHRSAVARAADLGHPSVVSNDAGERPTRSRRELSIATVLASEAAGGITLTIALLVAVAWATVAPESYTATITSSVHLPTISSAVISDRASLVVNLLMVVFFAGIGLEIGRERSVGALRDRATATLPVVAALGGMVGAAVVYLAGIALLGPQGASAGWGIPMATDIAFTLAALSLIPGRVSLSLRIFLLALAVADDVLSVVVLAFNGHAGPSGGTLTLALAIAVAAAALTAAVMARRRRSHWSAWIVLCAGLWWAMASLGIEPTLAGVIVGVMVPNGTDPALPGVTLERAVVPVATFVVLPLFGIVAGGIDLSTISSTMSGGLLVSLLAARSIGKLIGIAGAVGIAIRLGLGSLPAETNWRQMIGAALTCGIGFTVPLLFAEQSFGAHPSLLATTKVGLLLASLLCAIVGLITMAAGSPRPSQRD